MSKTRIIILIFIIAAILASLSVFVLRRPHSKRPVIGILNYTGAAETSVEGFREGMKDLGYTDGHDIEIIYRGVFADAAALETEAEYLRDIPVDIILTMSTQATLAAEKVLEGSDIPIVFGPVSNPIENGIVTDLLHKGENITGVMFGMQEDKRLEILKELKPDIRKVFIPYDFSGTSPSNSVRKLEEARKTLGMEFIHCDVPDPSAIGEIMESMPSDVEAVFIPTDPMMAPRSGEIAEYATAAGLISSAPYRDGVKAGALYSFSFDLLELGKEVARLVDQILTGTPAEELPVETSEFFLSFNLTTARRLNIRIPERLLRNAVLYE